MTAGKTKSMQIKPLYIIPNALLSGKDRLTRKIALIKINKDIKINLVLKLLV